MLTTPTETMQTPTGETFEAPLIYTPPPKDQTATAVCLAQGERATLSWITGLHTYVVLPDEDETNHFAAIFQHEAEMLRFKAERSLAEYDLQSGPSIWLVQPKKYGTLVGLTTFTPAVLHCFTPIKIPLRMHLEELHEKLCRTPIPSDVIDYVMGQTALVRASTDFIV